MSDPIQPPEGSSVEPRETPAFAGGSGSRSGPAGATPADQPPKPLLRRTLWQRRIRDPIVAQLTQGITPEKLALTVAVGSAMAVCPILGTATPLCLIAGIVLRLNQPLIQTVNLMCGPIHIPLVFAYAWLGEKLFGSAHVKFSISYMYSLLWNDFPEFLRRFGATAFHAFVAWVLASIIWIAVVYLVTRPIFRQIARIRAENAIKALKDAPPTHPVP